MRLLNQRHCIRYLSCKLTTNLINFFKLNLTNLIPIIIFGSRDDFEHSEKELAHCLLKINQISGTRKDFSPFNHAVAFLGSDQVYYSTWLRNKLGWRLDLNVLNANPATISLKKILLTPKRNCL